ncbi:MAG: RagB/SusD family nutrient uptake outer membrane protein [Rikenellaceae bacterium]
MKKLKIYILSVVTLALTSCDALSLGAIDDYSLENYWNTSEQCDRFMYGLYNRLRSRQFTFFMMGELRGGLFQTSSSTSIGQGAYYVEIISNNLSAINPGITNWGNFYMDIYQMNHAIDKISNECSFLTTDERNQYLGQLYGMRAYYYFHLHRTYGGVPLCDEPDVLNTDDLVALDKPRSTEREIYEFVKADAARSYEAYSSLSYGRLDNSPAYWNKAATDCLYADVLLWGAKVTPIGESSLFSSDADGDMTLARDILLSAEGQSSLADEFGTQFEDDDDDEIIVSVYYNYGEATNSWGLFTYHISSFTGYSDRDGNLLEDPYEVSTAGSLYYEYEFDIYSELSSNDTRRDFTYFDFYKTDSSSGAEIEGVFLIKFKGEVIDGARRFDSDWPIYRHADISLMLAEIYNELGDQTNTAKYINEIRTRAYEAGTAPTFTYTTSDAAEEAILAERDIEFVAEGKRWYDVRRMLGGEKALDLVQGGNEQLLLWPIDASTLSSDANVEQTPGY